VNRSPLSTRRVIRPLPRCARAAPMSPTSWCWSWRLTTASWSRRSRRSATPKRRKRVRQELLQHEIVVEQLGGEVLDVEVSALRRTNLDKLEEAILLQAELLDLTANPNRPAEGVVLE